MKGQGYIIGLKTVSKLNEVFMSILVASCQVSSKYISYKVDVSLLGIQ